jgi:hypothetical protein
MDACTARAFAPPRRSWQAASEILSSSGYLIYWAGEGYAAAKDLPPDVSERLFSTPTLARSGPLVIMARQ